jgi:phosphohistidine swiveling domain-containing protein
LSAVAGDLLLVVGLDDEVAQDPALTGGKAAALARAARAGLATLPGVVLTTAFCEAVDAGRVVAVAAPAGGAPSASPTPAAPAGPAASIAPDAAAGADAGGDAGGEPVHPAVREAFTRAGGETQVLVARSSSVVEDTAESSMAGQFASILGIRGLDAFAEAVQSVLDSRESAGAAEDPVAVLVQPMLEPAFGGVLFGVDPVTGRSDRRVVSVVRGGPDRLVSGEVAGSRYLLDPGGAVVESSIGQPPTGDAVLERSQLRRLAALSAEVARTFGGPQDVEWAIDTDGRLWLLQSRPVTTEVRGVPQGPVYGPGPVAETFPEPLTELERDLWVPPLCQAVREAVLLTGAATPAQVAATDPVVCVDGHVAIDLQLAGEIRPRRRVARNLNPFTAVRRVRDAWQVGRLRAALPHLAEELLDRADADLESVPALGELTSRQLIALLHRCQMILRALHAHEILMGMLTDTGGNRMTGASVALRVLVEARQDGLSDQEILHRSPVVLALSPPRVAPSPDLPAQASAVQLVDGDEDQGGTDDGIDREALRLRVRWVQELSSRAAWELGERLARQGHLTDPGLVRHMDLDHLEAVATKRAVVVPSLVAQHEHRFGPPLPAWFQLSDRGRPIRVQCASEVGGGTGAGGGVGTGPVTYDSHDPPARSVLVTTTLSPGLAPLLSRLAGIVAETGSVLSHLAILAREAGVPTVVGYVGATRDLPEGAVVQVDGGSGQVTIQEPDPEPTDPAATAAAPAGAGSPSGSGVSPASGASPASGGAAHRGDDDRDDGSGRDDDREAVP